MTAFGRACVSSSFGRFIAEIQSVNRKHLEINTFLPKELLRFDSDVKNWIASKVSRGSLNVKISACFETESPLIVTPNLALARQIKLAWDAIAKDLNLESEFELNMLVREPGILLYDEDIADEEKCREILKQTIEEALEALVAMKAREGAILQADIFQRLQSLYGPIDRIALKTPGATEKYRQKLMARLEEILPGHIENEERILKEIGLYAEKIDISEEVDRFNSHLIQFEELLNKESSGIGKTLDFLVQELNREANTIGSKASDIEVTRAVIEIKSELEKIREQLQNIE